MFKVNNKNTRVNSMTSFWYFYVNFGHISFFFSNVSFVDFEQVNTSRVIEFRITCVLDSTSI